MSEYLSALSFLLSIMTSCSSTGSISFIQWEFSVKFIYYYHHCLVVSKTMPTLLVVKNLTQYALPWHYSFVFWYHSSTHSSYSDLLLKVPIFRVCCDFSVIIVTLYIYWRIDPFRPWWPANLEEKRLFLLLFAYSISSYFPIGDT